MKTRQLRNGTSPVVIMSAFACEPGRGSEPGCGFEFARALASVAQERGWTAYLLTRGHRTEEIRSALKNHGVFEGIKIVPVRVPRSIVRVTGRRHVRIAYIMWQARAVAAARKIAKYSSGPIVYHHVTFATEALPTAVPFLPKRVRVVFGPFGSALQENGIQLSKRALRRIRAIIGRFNLQFVDMAIVQNDDILRSLNVRRSTSTSVEPNAVVAPDEKEIGTYLFRDIDGNVHDIRKVHPILSVGRLIPRKRVHLAIDAMSRIGTPGSELWVFGDGPERQGLIDRARRVGVEDRVRFFGEVERNTLWSAMRQSAALLHLSEQEGAPWAVAEAQAAGACPIVCRGGGADTLVRLGEYGTVIDSADADAVATAVRSAVETPRVQVSRWSGERFTRLLPEWYGL